MTTATTKLQLRSSSLTYNKTFALHRRRQSVRVEGGVTHLFLMDEFYYWPDSHVESLNWHPT